MKYSRRNFLQTLGITVGSIAAYPYAQGSTNHSSHHFDMDSQGLCTLDYWLCENHAPVGESESFNLQVEGTLPPSLNGIYIRNGPNPLSGKSSHHFLGDGMVHGVQLRHGTAIWSRSRYVNTELLGAAPIQGLPTLEQNPSNTNVIAHAGHILSLAESGLPYELSANLNTMGSYNFGGALNSPMTAHPKIDPRTGELLFFGTGINTPTIHYHEVNRHGLLTRTEVLNLPAPVFMHDFQMTKTRVVFMDLPMLSDPEIAKIYQGIGFKWTPENGARIGILPRSSSADMVKWIEIDPCFIYHTFNAYDDPSYPSRIILDAIRYPKMWVTSPIDVDYPNELVRYTIDVDNGSVSSQTLYGTSIEFPAIDERRQGVQNQFGYSVVVPPGSVGGSEAIMKFDFLTGQSEKYSLDGLLTGELTFVPNHPSSGEDEGWLISFAYEPEGNTSKLLVFDATHISAGPIASVQMPARVPYGFHGSFIRAPSFRHPFLKKRKKETDRYREPD